MQNDSRHLQSLLLSLNPKELALLDQQLITLEKADAQTWTFKQFIVNSWHIVEPGSQFVDGWHIDAICDHLTALYNLEIRNLVINMPPRHAKSLLCSVFFNCWVWTKNAQLKFLCASYAQPLSTRDSLKCRRLLQSPWFVKRYSHLFTLTADQRAKMRFDNSLLGYRISTSVGGVGTGEGGDFIITDDPNNVVDAESQAKRDETNIWWDESMSTRGNDPKTVRRLIIQQRTAEEDLTGHVLKQGGYEHLCLPAEYEPRIYVTSIGWSDPRKEDGELLWPERFDVEALDELKLRLGTYGAAGQLQQRPAPRGGGIIQDSWWCHFEPTYNDKYEIISPSFEYVLQSWDTAFKDGQENDFSVCNTYGVNKAGIYMIHRYKGKLTYPDLLEKCKNLAKTYNPNVILIEDKASGQSLIQTLKRETRLPIKAFKIDHGQDKIARLHAVSPFIESGRVFLLKNAAWVADYVYNMGVFPAGAHDDDVDATSMALAHVFLHTRTQPLPNINIMGR
jgi:predicted phage terminase large subunit-like protein